MPEKVHKLYTELNAEVEFLAIKADTALIEIIAHVVDTGSTGMADKLVSEAVELAYQGNHDIPDELQSQVQAACVIPDPSRNNAWYTHVSILLRRR